MRRTLLLPTLFALGATQLACVDALPTAGGGSGHADAGAISAKKGRPGSSNPQTVLTLGGGTSLRDDGAPAYVAGQCGVIGQIQVGNERRDATTDVDGGWKSLSRDAKAACGSPREMHLIHADGTADPVYYVNVRRLGWYPDPDGVQPLLGTVGLMTRGRCGTVYFGTDPDYPEATPLFIEEATMSDGNRRWRVRNDPSVATPRAYCVSTGTYEPLAIDLHVEAQSTF